MSFSDEDLKRLKSLYDSSESTMENKLIKGLVRRLEAAEAVCQQAEVYVTNETPRMFRFKELLKAWRKAAGK